MYVVIDLDVLIASDYSFYKQATHYDRPGF